MSYTISTGVDYTVRTQPCPTVVIDIQFATSNSSNAFCRMFNAAF
ncbi:hypothetical protein [Bacillus sp. EB600]|nr:hypothetical protein [Bacillus sp. EB600]